MEVEFEVVDDKLVRRFRVGAATYESAVGRQSEAPRDASLLSEWWAAYFRGVRPAPLGTGTVKRVRAVELFCGPGGLANGFSQGVTELGATPDFLFAVDQDGEAVDVYARNHEVRDVRRQSVSELLDYRVVRSQGGGVKFAYTPEVVDPKLALASGHTDVVLAGPPCQGHSNLNNHTRRTDARNQLYLTVPAAAIALKADAILIENVPAILHDTEDVVGQTCALLADAGYLVETGVLRAAAMGWPQTRSRHFLLARKSAAPLPISEIQEALRDDPRSVLWAIGDLVDEPEDQLMNRRPIMSQENVRRVRYLHDENQFDLPLPLRPKSHQNGTTYTSVYGRMYPDRPAPTLTTGFLTPGRGRFVHPTRARTLTPREAARLQGFPDAYDFTTDRREIPTSSSLAKWIGDAVPMVLGHAATIGLLAPVADVQPQR